ncbi:MAG: CehA/McbA family metallohydrolase [Mariniphaga sp.]|nr:CehA/McbA family metallohydrolase [Mariniphaga sp.]
MEKRTNIFLFNKKVIVGLTVFISIIFLGTDGLAQPSFIQLQWQDSPEAISNANPNFFWRSEGDQTAYQIIVSTDLNKINSNKGDLWDSGKVNSKKSSGISYAGGILKRNTKYYWKVRLWIDDEVTDYSNTKSFKMGDHLISMSPQKEIIAENWETIIFKIEVGEAGLAIGDGFSILGAVSGNRFKWKIRQLAWSLWQTSNPESPGFTTVTTSREGAVVVPEVIGERKVLNLTVSNKNMLPGDVITVVYGDKSKGSPGVKVSALALRCFFPLCKLNDNGDTWGSRAWEKYKDAPSIEIVGKKATKFNVVANPIQRIGEKFSLKVIAVDDKGNLDVNYDGTVNFQSSDNLAQLPEEYTFTKFDRGMHSFGVELGTRDYNTINVSQGDVTGNSNVINVSSNKKVGNIFFGDFHGHSWFSDGVLWIDDHYLYAKDVAGLDFAGVTDHSEDPYNFSKELVVPFVNRFHQQSEFVTLYTHEWTRGGGFGHINPLFLHEKEFDIFNASDYDNPDELWEALKGREVITPPHHPAAEHDGGAGGYNWDFYNKEFLKTVEIASKHGISECMPEDGNPYPIRGGMNPKRTVQYALGEKGYKLGIIGSSDAHATRLGELYHPMGGYETSVITAAYSENLSREAIYNAIKNRNTYATTGEKILVEFSINGYPMGSEFELAKSEKPSINVKVGGTNEIKDVVVWKYSLDKGWEKNLVIDGNSTIVSREFIDNDFNQNSLYYVRVTQEGEPLELAWTSPIWINIQE